MPTAKDEVEAPQPPDPASHEVDHFLVANRFGAERHDTIKEIEVCVAEGPDHAAAVPIAWVPPARDAHAGPRAGLDWASERRTSPHPLDPRAMSGCAAERAVARHERCVERLGGSDVDPIVGGDVVPQLPHAIEEIDVSMPQEVEDSMTFRGWCLSIDDYARALEAAGFVIEALREPLPGPGAPPTTRGRRLPIFLMMRLVKRP